MKLETVTKIILIVVGVFLIAYDFVPFHNPERGDTISEVLLLWSLHCFTLPYGIGLLCGHFFLPKDGCRPKPGVLLSVGGLVILLDAITWGFDVRVLMTLQSYPFIAFVVGIPVGSIFWTQSRSDKL